MSLTLPQIMRPAPAKQLRPTQHHHQAVLKNKENSFIGNQSHSRAETAGNAPLQSGRTRQSVVASGGAYSVIGQTQSRERLPPSQAQMSGLRKYRNREFGRDVTNASSNISTSSHNGSSAPYYDKKQIPLSGVRHKALSKAKGDKQNAIDITFEDSKRPSISSQGGTSIQKATTDSERSAYPGSTHQAITHRQKSVAHISQRPPSNSQLRQAIKVNKAEVSKNLSEEEKNRRRKEQLKCLEQCDLLDIRNPQCVAEYAGDILQNILTEEKRFKIRSDFLSTHTNLQMKTRGCVMEWVAEVCEKFRLLPESFFVTANLIDLYCQKTPKELKKTDLQTMAIASLLIATKYEEIYPPSIKEMIKISGDMKIQKPDVLKFEKDILFTLGFDCTFPTPYRFLERYVKLCNAPETVFNHAHYLVELCQISGDLISTYMPSEIAAAAICLSYKTVVKQSIGWEQSDKHSLARATGYTESSISEVAKRMISEFSRLKELDLVMGVKKKFSKDKYLCVSKLPLYTSIN